MAQKLQNEIDAGKNVESVRKDGVSIQELNEKEMRVKQTEVQSNEGAGDNQKIGLEDPMDTTISREKVDFSGTDHGRATNSDSSVSFGTKLKNVQDGKSARANRSLSEVLTEVEIQCQTG